MSHLAYRAQAASFGSFGGALLPEERVSPSRARLVTRVDRYLTQLTAPARAGGAHRASLADRDEPLDHRPTAVAT